MFLFSAQYQDVATLGMKYISFRLDEDPHERYILPFPSVQHAFRTTPLVKPSSTPLSMQRSRRTQLSLRTNSAR